MKKGAQTNVSLSRMNQVSIIIPTYNRAAFLLHAVQSVLAQTFQDFEIIIIDDGSTDNTAQLIHSLQEPRIRYLTQANQGVAAALNRGWRAAKGTYIGRIDSDDAWLPTLLERLVPVLERDTTLGAVYARAQGMDASGQTLPQLSGAPERFPGETLKSLVYGDFVTPIAVIIQRAALERVGGYDESLPGTEDWDLWIRLAPYYGIAYVPEILARYRYHANNLTRAGSERMTRLMQDRLRILDKFFAQQNVPSDILAIKSTAYRNVYLDWTIRSLEAKQWRNAARPFRRACALAANPFTFGVRALTVAAYYLYLSKTRWGVTLVDQLVARRRRTTDA